MMRMQFGLSVVLVVSGLGSFVYSLFASKCATPHVYNWADYHGIALMGIFIGAALILAFTHLANP